jgi:carbamoyltransferase
VKVLGLSAFYHDSAAALIVDGKIVAAAQEERFTRKKHDSRFPHSALAYCLNEGRITLHDVDYIVFYDKPFLKFERLLETYLGFAPRGFRSFQAATPLWLKEKLFQKHLLREKLSAFASGLDCQAKLLFAEHHQSHAASAFFPSPFEEAIVLTIDGVGEWATASVAFGRGNHLEMRKELHFPHSLGLLYSAFTYHIGFKVNSGEYKMMGLAPYGKPKYADLIFERLLDLKSDGTFRLDQSYFDYCTGLRMTNEKFDSLFGRPRGPEEAFDQRHMDLAASIQAVTEEIVLRLTRSIAFETGAENLCLAGGVALNSVANGKVLRDRRFKRIWIQPAAGDAGGALGAALAAYYSHGGQARVLDNKIDGMSGAFLGPGYADEECVRRLKGAGARFVQLDSAELIERTASDLTCGKAVGWFQGRMEFGPRALGNRSIIADARAPSTQSALNLKIKFRESFRPFAPAVLCEDVVEWFDLNTESPYMLLVADVAERWRCKITPQQQALVGFDKLGVVRSVVPAVTHVDFSARVQTVHAETNPRFHALLSAFKRMTGCPVLVNTSFNVRGEPIVQTPEDAFRCFMGTGLDALAIGNLYLEKSGQNSTLKLDYRNGFERD